MFKIIILISESAGGKDHILNTVVKSNPNIKTITSYTSRPIRVGETDGVTYHYISDEEANKMLNNDEFIEYRSYETVKGRWIYGMGKGSFDLNSNETYIAILDLQGLKQLEKYLKENDKLDSLTSIYIKAKGHTRLLRSLQREGELNNDKCKEICRRFISDEDDMRDAEKYCNITLINETKEDLDYCVEYIKNLYMEEVTSGCIR